MSTNCRWSRQEIAAPTRQDSHSKLYQWVHVTPCDCDPDTCATCRSFPPPPKQTADPRQAKPGQGRNQSPL